MTRSEVGAAINDLAWRLVDLLKDRGIYDTSPAKVADLALKALGVEPSELDAGLTAPPAPVTVHTCVVLTGCPHVRCPVALCQPVS